MGFQVGAGFLQADHAGRVALSAPNGRSHRYSTWPPESCFTWSLQSSYAEEDY
jgi:hypothetical protein